MPNVALEEEVIAGAITIALILYLHASDVHQHTEPCERLLRPPEKSRWGRLISASI